MKLQATLVACLTMLVSFTAFAQNDVTYLNGFQLEQYRETTLGEFGKPTQQDKHDDGVEYDIFVITKEPQLYMIFEYLPSNQEAIFTIQVTGTDAKANIRFKGLHLGDAAADVQKVLGEPTEKFDIGEYGERWSYNDNNYSVEINQFGKLSSIKIKNNFPENKPEAAILPDFKKDILPKLTSGKNADIATLLAPDVEVTSHEKLFYFSQSFDTEIKEDEGKVYTAIKLDSKGLKKVNTSKVENYEEDIRLVEGMEPLHVIKINDANCNIKEIVFKYMNGKWLIWEFKAA